MAEETTTTKVWKVLLGVEADRLEDILNTHVDEGLQAYRIDRVEKWVKFDQKTVVYDVILFNPMLLGERASKKFSDAILAQIGQPGSLAPQGPIPGPVSGA